MGMKPVTQEEVRHQGVLLSTGPSAKEDYCPSDLQDSTFRGYLYSVFYEHHGGKVSLHLKPIKLASHCPKFLTLATS